MKRYKFKMKNPCDNTEVAAETLREAIDECSQYAYWDLDNVEEITMREVPTRVPPKAPKTLLLTEMEAIKLLELVDDYWTCATDSIGTRRLRRKLSRLVNPEIGTTEGWDDGWSADINKNMGRDQS